MSLFKDMEMFEKIGGEFVDFGLVMDKGRILKEEIMGLEEIYFRGNKIMVGVGSEKVSMKCKFYVSKNEDCLCVEFKLRKGEDKWLIRLIVDEDDNVSKEEDKILKSKKIKLF